MPSESARLFIERGGLYNPVHAPFLFDLSSHSTFGKQRLGENLIGGFMLLFIWDAFSA